MRLDLYSIPHLGLRMLSLALGRKLAKRRGVKPIRPKSLIAHILRLANGINAGKVRLELP
jgi:hypothetical protein